MKKRIIKSSDANRTCWYTQAVYCVWFNVFLAGADVSICSPKQTEPDLHQT